MRELSTHPTSTRISKDPLRQLVNISISNANAGSEQQDMPLRYVLGTADGVPRGPTIAPRARPGVNGLDTGEYRAGLVAQFVAGTGLAMPGGLATPTELVVVGALPMAFTGDCRWGEG
jgi:hypothetical protein